MKFAIAIALMALPFWCLFVANRVSEMDKKALAEGKEEMSAGLALFTVILSTVVFDVLTFCFALGANLLFS